MTQTEVEVNNMGGVESNNMTIVISDEFSRYPGGRYRRFGPHSGEEFRETILEPRFSNAVESGTRLTVELDGVATYAGSFLEEAFGGLIRSGSYDNDTISKTLVIKASGPYLIFKRLALKYISEAVERVH